MKTTLLALASVLALAAALAAPVSALAAGELKMPDFTAGDAIPARAKHDWNLGPTGLAGGCFAISW